MLFKKEFRELVDKLSEIAKSITEVNFRIPKPEPTLVEIIYRTNCDCAVQVPQLRQLIVDVNQNLAARIGQLEIQMGGLMKEHFLLKESAAAERGQAGRSPGPESPNKQHRCGEKT